MKKQIIKFIIITFIWSLTSTMGSAQINNETQQLKNPNLQYPKTSKKYRGVVSADFDYDGRDELMCDFGSLGMWLADYNSGTDTFTWHKINNSNPDWIIAFHYSGLDYIWADFGSKGLWLWGYAGSYPGVWEKHNNNNAEYAFSIDDMNSGKDSLHIDFGSKGLWRYCYPNWMKMNTHDSQGGLITDLCGSEEAGVFDFGPLGLWQIYYPSGVKTVSKLNNNNAGDDYISADVGGGSAEDLVIDFASLGLWIQESTWHKVNSNSVSDLRAPSEYNHWKYFIASFNGINGLWKWTYGTGFPGSWSKINPNTPTFDEAFCEFVNIDYCDEAWYFLPYSDEIVADFGSLGLWIKYGGWLKLSNHSPDFMVKTGKILGSWGENLIVDFGTLGLWLYYYDFDHFWRKLNSHSPDSY